MCQILSKALGVSDKKANMFLALMELLFKREKGIQRSVNCDKSYIGKMQETIKSVLL